MASLVGVPTREELYVDEPPTALCESPLVRVRLPGVAAAQKICERAVLIKAVIKVWGTGTGHEEAVRSALAETSAGVLAQRRSMIAPPRTYQIRVAAFGRTPTMDDKRSAMEIMKPLFQGDEVADLRDPETTVWSLEEHAHRTEQKTHLGPRTGLPQRVIIGHQVAGGRSLDKKSASGEKAYYARFELAERAVLGPTTMENQLAFIMANCACARPGALSLDPFCGTGGLLIAVTHFGAKVHGGEIDLRVIKGWRVAYIKNKAAAEKVVGKFENAAPRNSSAGQTNKQRATASRSSPAHVQTSVPLSLGYLGDIGLVPAVSREPKAVNGEGASEADARHIFTNFLQYELPTPEIVICDTSVPPWRHPATGWLDCIVTDPPYGVRAASKKQGRAEGSRVIRDHHAYIPSKVNYGEEELSCDLLELAATALKDGGRITYLLPVDLADFLGVDRAAERGAAGTRGTLRDAAMPDAGRKKKDNRLIISETTRDPLLLDESRYHDFLGSHSALELCGASLQVLSGGLGRLLVTMKRRPR